MRYVKGSLRGPKMDGMILLLYKLISVLENLLLDWLSTGLGSSLSCRGSSAGCESSTSVFDINTGGLIDVAILSIIDLHSSARSLGAVPPVRILSNKASSSLPSECAFPMRSSRLQEFFVQLMCYPQNQHLCVTLPLLGTQ